MPRIDSHQHFWKYLPERDTWINDEMKSIQKDFLPADLLPLLNRHEFKGSVVVQSHQSEAENEFQLKNAAEFDFIKGVVGWTDLCSPSLEERLEYYTENKKLKGFRHVLQGEKDRAYMLQPAFMNGVRLLEKYNFTYDILIYHDQLNYTIEFARSFPNQRLVIDHIAKPDIRKKEISIWKKQMELLAQNENVYCKISGMVTEADWKSWKKEDLVPYMDVVVNAFGTKRIMFGSDWPVCLVAAPYETVTRLAQDYFSSFSIAEQDLFFGDNATEFYNLNW